MTFHPVLARAANLFHSSAGLSITTLLGSLGAACAVVIVTRYFLGFLKTQRNSQAWIIENFRRHHAESQQKFQEQVDRLSSRQIRNQHDFQKHIDRMTESQTVILRDAIVTMNRMELAVEASSKTIRGIQASLGSLNRTIQGIEDVLSGTTRVASGPGGFRPAGTVHNDSSISWADGAYDRGGFLIFAVVAYLIGDLESNAAAARSGPARPGDTA